MYAMGETHRLRIRLWSDWLLVAAGLVVLGILLDQVADVVFNYGGTILYWFLMVYTYPDGTPLATLFGLAIVAVTLLAYWSSLRLLAHAGLAPVRVLAILALTIAATGCAVLTFVIAPLVSDTSPLSSGPLTLGFGLLTVVLVMGLALLLRTAVRAWRERDARVQRERPWSRLLRPLVPSVVMTVLVMTIAPIALLIGERPTNYRHLASASFQAHRYYLALEVPPSESTSVLLYRCDTLGVWCQEIDSLATAGDGQSDNGRLHYDSGTQLLTASDGENRILTYPAGDLFGGP
jgi:hypothetical protein